MQKLFEVNCFKFLLCYSWTCVRNVVDLCQTSNINPDYLFATIVEKTVSPAGCGSWQNDYDDQFDR